MFGVLTTLSSVASIILIFYYYSKTRFNIWKKKGVPYVTPAPILGNYAGYILLQRFIGDVLGDLCRKFPNAPYFGAFYGTEPTLVVKDPETIKLIMTKDFYYFSGREISKYTHNEVFTSNIFFSGGDRWRVVRQNLTPLFSSAKMKNMLYLVERSAIALEKCLSEEIDETTEVDIRQLISRYTMASIGSCAFGLDTHTMEKHQEANPFFTIGMNIFVNTNYRGFKTVLRAIWPSIFYGLGFKLFPVAMDTFFSKVLTAAFKSRGYKPSNKNDFVDLILGFNERSCITGDSLTSMKNGCSEKVNIGVDNALLVAQCITFFVGGFETSAASLSFLLYELAMNEDIQKRAQAEVDSFLKVHSNRLTYDCVKELPFLDACLNETLRKYPVIANLTREVVEEYSFPSGLVLEKGMRIHLPVYYLHHNPDFYPEPEQFLPDRFLPENRGNIIPYSYLPFGEGPRVCIGIRFAKMQMLAGLVSVLKKYNVSLAKGMPRKMPLEPRTLVTYPCVTIRLTMTKRDGWEQREFIPS